MNARQARGLAYFHVWQIMESTINEGWTACNFQYYTASEEFQIDRAVDEVMAELEVKANARHKVLKKGK